LSTASAPRIAEGSGPDAERWWKKTQPVFSELHLDPDGYVLVTHDHAATPMWKVGEFLRDPGKQAD
jgi:hypothetical protein